MLADTYEPTIFFPGGATRRAEPMSDVLTDHDLIGLDPEMAGDWINRYGPRTRYPRLQLVTHGPSP